MNKYYELYSLSVEIAAVLTITYFLIINIPHCVKMFEPIIYIRVPEILIGLSIIPYYYIKILK